MESSISCSAGSKNLAFFIEVFPVLPEKPWWQVGQSRSLQDMPDNAVRLHQPTKTPELCQLVPNLRTQEVAEPRL